MYIQKFNNPENFTNCQECGGDTGPHYDISFNRPIIGIFNLQISLQLCETCYNELQNAGYIDNADGDEEDTEVPKP